MENYNVSFNDRCQEKYKLTVDIINQYSILIFDSQSYTINM